MSTRNQTRDQVGKVGCVARAWSDEELLGRALGGEERAWKELLRRFRALIYGCISRLISRHRGHLGSSDADEIYAEVLVALLADDKRRLRAFDPTRGVKLSSWIGLLTSRLAVDYLRARAARPGSSADPIDGAPEVESGAASPLDTLLALEERARVSRALAHYSERDRTFITLYAHGLGVEQIADRLQIRISTVYSRKHKLLNRLKHSLQPAA